MNADAEHGGDDAQQCNFYFCRVALCKQCDSRVDYRKPPSRVFSFIFYIFSECFPAVPNNKYIMQKHFFIGLLLCGR